MNLLRTVTVTATALLVLTTLTGPATGANPAYESAVGQFSTEPWCRHGTERTWCITMNRGQMTIDRADSPGIVLAYECDNDTWEQLYVGFRGRKGISDVEDADTLTVRWNDAEPTQVRTRATFSKKKTYSKKGKYVYDMLDLEQLLALLASATSLSVEIPYLLIDPHWVRFELPNARASITKTRRMCREH